MGMSYEELSVYGRMRKIARCGPLAMYRQCAQLWSGRCGQGSYISENYNNVTYIYIGNGADTTTQQNT